MAWFGHFLEIGWTEMSCVRNKVLNLMGGVGGQQQAALQTGGGTLQQAFDIHQQGTQCPQWHTCEHTHAHTPADISTAVQTRLITSHSPSYHSHQGPDHTVGRRPATGGRVLAFSRVRNTSGLISSSTSQIPGPDISSRCYCFAWALLSCPFLSTTALRKGLHSQAGCVCVE